MTALRQLPSQNLATRRLGGGLSLPGSPPRRPGFGGQTDRAAAGASGRASPPTTVETIATRYLHFVDVYLAAATMEA